VAAPLSGRKPAGPLQDIERHKLNAMGAFAEAQTCRRLVLLNYFGEGRQEPCGNCDICLDPPKQYDGLMDARKALSTIYRVNQRFGMGYVVEVLRGANNQRIREMGHDKLPVYGIGREQSHEHWVSVIRQLIHLGLVTQNIAQHSALQLTEAARPVLRGDVPLQLAVPRIVALKPKAMQKSFGGNYDRKLFAKLRKLRKAIADEENIPPYVVFNDATLIEMAEQSPLTAGEMLSVNGVGTRKLERFGKEFMALIRRMSMAMMSSQLAKKCQNSFLFIIFLRVNYADAFPHRGAGAYHCADEPGAGLFLCLTNGHQPLAQRGDDGCAGDHLRRHDLGGVALLGLNLILARWRGCITSLWSAGACICAGWATRCCAAR
jgi:hypothetical protein